MVLMTSIPVAARTRAPKDILASAKTALSVRHPHVLALLEYEPHDQEILLVSEYLDGELLGQLLAQASLQSMPFPQNVALKIIRDTIDTLASLRSKGATANVTGGLSPEVVFVASYGEAMVRHPGVNEAAMQQLSMRRHPAALPYRAPEQLLSPRKIDDRADVFSAGALLWEMLAGKPLFGLKSHRQLGRVRKYSEHEMREVQHRIRSQKVPSLASVQRSGGALHPAVVELVDWALHRDAEDRFSSLEEMRETIDGLPAGAVADTSTVAATVERLAGPSIARRQQHLADIAPIPLHSSAPPSGRITAFPEEDAQVTVAIPKQVDQGKLEDLMRAEAKQVTSSETNEPDSRGVTAERRPDAADSQAPTVVRRGKVPDSRRPTARRRPRVPEPAVAASQQATQQAESIEVIEEFNVVSEPPSTKREGRAKASPPSPRLPPPPRSTAERGSLDVRATEEALASSAREGSSAGPPPAIEMPSLEPGRSRAGTWVIATIAILALSTGAYAWTTLNDQEESPQARGVKASDGEHASSRAAEVLETERDTLPEERTDQPPTDLDVEERPGDATAAAAPPPDETTDETTDEGPSLEATQDKKEVEEKPAPPQRKPAQRSQPKPRQKSKHEGGVFRPSGI